jgi:hypothetical protein
MGNWLERHTSKFEQAAERISELEDGQVKMTESQK